jgi:hypothetical protein
MKYLIFALLMISAAATTQAQDRWLYWKYKDYDGSITFTVPRVAIGTGSLFIKQKSERKMLRRVHKVRTMIFEDGSPLADRDIKRFTNKAKRHHLEEIVTVRNGKTHVRVLAKTTRRNALRKVVVFVNSPDDGFVMVSVKGKIKMTDVNQLFTKFNGKKGGGQNGKKIIPDLLKIDTGKA